MNDKRVITSSLLYAVSANFLVIVGILLFVSDVANATDTITGTVVVIVGHVIAWASAVCFYFKEAPASFDIRILLSVYFVFFYAIINVVINPITQLIFLATLPQGFGYFFNAALPLIICTGIYAHLKRSR